MAKEENSKFLNKKHFLMSSSEIVDQKEKLHLKLLDIVENLTNTEAQFVQQYTKVYNSKSVEYEIYLKIARGKLKTPYDSIKIMAFVDFTCLNTIITTFEEAYDFYSNIQLIFNMFQCNTSSEKELINRTLTNHQVGIVEMGNDYYVFAHKSLEFCLKINFQVFLLMKNCDFVFIKITNYDVFKCLVENQIQIKINTIEKSIRDKYLDEKKINEDLLKKLEEQQKEYTKTIQEHKSKIQEMEIKLHEVDSEYKKLQNLFSKKEKEIENYSLDKFGIDFFGEYENTYLFHRKKNGICLIDDIEFESVHNLITKKSDEGSKQDEKSNYLCLYCLEKERNVFFEKCRHCLICSDCLKNLKKSGNCYECYLCRKLSPIKKIIFS